MKDEISELTDEKLKLFWQETKVRIHDNEENEMAQLLHMLLNRIEKEMNSRIA